MARVCGDQHVVPADGIPFFSLLERDANRGIDTLDIGLQRPDGERSEDSFDLTRESPAAALGGAKAQFARHDDAREHVGLALVGNALGHGSLR